MEHATAQPSTVGSRLILTGGESWVSPCSASRGRPSRVVPLVIVFYVALYVLFFAPVLVSEGLLAPLGDGLNFFLPVVCSGPKLWTSSLFGGYPLAADPQAMSWYPPALLLAYPDGRWNVLVLLGYVLASTCAFLLVRALTGSELGGLVSGLVYGMSGFFMGHLGHTNMIHSAAWLPLIVLGIHELKGGFHTGWFCATALGTALCILGGHPQIATYSVSLSGIYAVFQGRHVAWGRFRYCAACLGAMGVGIGLAGLQVVPTVELAGMSERATLSYKEFTALYLPSNQLPMLLFPWACGGSGGALYGLPYFGKWNCAELSGYVGLVPLVVAFVPVVARRREPEVWFWIVVALVALLLALGRKTPLAVALYWIPPYNLFRGPARHFLEYTLAVSVLSGYGIAAVQRLPDSLRRLRIRRSLLCFAVLFGAAMCKLLLDGRGWEERAVASGVGSLSMLPWKNPAVGVPIVVAAAGAAAVSWWSRSTRWAAGAVLTGVIAMDLGSYGWFHTWRYDAPKFSDAAGANRFGEVARILPVGQQRAAHWDVAHMSLDQAPPNLSLLRGLPNVGGYSPLRLRRHAEFLDGAAYGGLTGSSLRGPSQAANLLGMRLLLLPRRADAPPTFVRHGATWSEKDWELAFGRHCVEASEEEVQLQLPETAAAGVALVTCMGHAMGVPDGAPVLEVDVGQVDGSWTTFTLRAGVHTAETAWERIGRSGSAAHRRAQVFRSFRSVDADDVPCEDHHYVAAVPFATTRRVQRMRMRWVGPDGVLLKLFKLSLLGTEHDGDAPVPESASVVGAARRWRRVADGVWENRDALPRAWLTSQVLRLEADGVLAAVHSGRLPDGSAFDPRSTALVEEAVHLRGEQGKGGTVQGVHETSSVLEVSTQAAQAGLLVTGDVFYPGWRATIDGTPTHVVRTNYLLRGVVVPAGTHTVQFVYRPTSFFVGCAVTAVATAVLVAMLAASALSRSALRGFRQ